MNQGQGKQEDRARCRNASFAKGLPALIAAMFMAPVAFGQSGEVPPFNSVSIARVAASGSGCPTGSVVPSLSSDNKALTLMN